MPLRYIEKLRYNYERGALWTAPTLTPICSPLMFAVTQGFTPLFSRMTRLEHYECSFRSITRLGEPSSVTQCSIPLFLKQPRDLGGYGSAKIMCPFSTRGQQAAKGTGRRQKVAQKKQPPFRPY